MTTFGVTIPSHGAGVAGAGADIVSAARRAEELGFDDGWFADHVVIPDYAVHVSGPAWLEPLAACCVCLGATSSLRFGTDVLVAPYRDPVLVAQLVATADQLSGGRLTLATGVGYIRGEFEALRAPAYERRGDVTDEYIDVWRTLWGAEGPVSFEGEFVRFVDVHARPGPVQDPLPVWVGGNGARAIGRAARRGDGWHPLFPTPEQYAAGRSAIEAARDRDRPFTYSYSCPPCQILDEGEPLPPPITYDALGDVPEEFGYAPPVPVDTDGRPRFVGTARQVAADIALFIDHGVEHFALRFMAHTLSEVLEQWERFARDVRPLVTPAPR